MTRRSSPKGVKPNADTEGESVKFGRSSARPLASQRSVRMSTKTTKRKRAAATAIEPMEAAVEPPVAASVAADVAAAEAAIVSPAVAGEPVVSLFSNSTVKDAAALKDTLLQVLDEPGSVAIDAKSVERIDTAIIQVLCAFVRDRAARNLVVTWRGAPQPLLDAARMLGVGALLALPSQAN
jgi:ABC-type transporter Mla MlaB component